MNKILIVCLAAYKPGFVIDPLDPDHHDRQELYAIALHQLIEIAPAEVDIIPIDNTVGKREELILSLQKELNRQRVKDTIFVNNNNLGGQNKGAGEYVMCRSLLSKYQNELLNYDWIIYYTSRYPMSFPLIFEYIEKFPEFEAIVANAEYLYADNQKIPPAPGNYNDVIFAMRSKCFMEYISSMDPTILTAKKMNSESNLYNFIHQNHKKLKPVYRFGILRYNYACHKMELI